MKRILILAGLLAVAVSLSGCDKCGEFQPLFSTGDSKSCGGGKTAS